MCGLVCWEPHRCPHPQETLQCHFVQAKFQIWNYLIEEVSGDNKLLSTPGRKSFFVSTWRLKVSSYMPSATSRYSVCHFLQQSKGASFPFSSKNIIKVNKPWFYFSIWRSVHIALAEQQQQLQRSICVDAGRLQAQCWLWVACVLAALRARHTITVVTRGRKQTRSIKRHLMKQEPVRGLCEQLYRLKQMQGAH